MKKARWLSAFSLIILSFCIMAVGVYSAYESDRNMGVGGTINIPANLIGVTINGYIGTDTTQTPDFTSENNPSGVWEFTDAQKTKMKFVSDTAVNAESVPTITLTFEIINNSDIGLQAYFANDDGEAPDSYLGGTEEAPIIEVEFGSDEDISAYDSQSENDKATITIAFKLKELLYEDTTFGFRYSLIVKEK